MIPEGYRLLTSADVGKTFGVDLECLAYIDTEINPLRMSGDVNYTNFIFCKIDPNMELPVIYIQDTVYEASGSINYWNYETATLPEGLEVTEFYTNYNWNDWFYVKDKSDPKTQFITDMNGLAESIVDKAGSSGKKTIKEMKSLVDGLKTEFVTQEKTVTPTSSSQAITPDSGKDGLSKVTVNAIPSNYIVPSGTLEVIENGEVDCTNYKKVNVNVPGSAGEEWDGSYEEIVSGFTLTLNCASAVINYEYNLYSLDGGTTWNQFTSETMILQNVTQIKFSETANGLTYLKVGTTEGGQDIASMLGYESDNIILTADTTWYVWSVVDYGGSN